MYKKNKVVGISQRYYCQKRMPSLWQTAGRSAWGMSSTRLQQCSICLAIHCHHDKTSLQHTHSRRLTYIRSFLPRCMKCRRGLAMRILSVCPSVRPSVKRVDCDKTKERSVHIFIPYKISFSLVFWEEWFVQVTPLPEILGQPAPVGAKSPIFNPYSLVAA